MVPYFSVRMKKKKMPCLLQVCFKEMTCGILRDAAARDSVGIIMIYYPVWISPSGQELCMVDSKGWIFKKSKPGKI